jgi:ATP-binding cassette, subfamily B, bacterial PglK
LIDSLRKLNALLSPGERKRAWIVVLMMLVLALTEVAGVASVMPFVTLLMNPNSVETNPYLRVVYQWFGYSNPEAFLFPAGLLVLLLFVGTLALKALTTYAIVRFSTMRLHTLACRLLAAYLRQPYEFFLGRNTAALAKSILSEATEVANGVLVPAMRLLSGAFVAAALFALLVAIEPILALVVAAVLGGIYAVSYLLTRDFTGRVGAARLQANRRRFILTNEILSAVKELRVLGREAAYLDRFHGPSLRFARYHASGIVVRELPRYAIEAIAFGGMLGALLYLLRRQGGVHDALPLVALYGFAGYRLLPILQQVFSNLSYLRFGRAAIDALYADLVQKAAREVEASVVVPLRLSDGLRLERVSYQYPDAQRSALTNIDVTIRAGSNVAFVGRTGAGKTTVIDIILGLLVPTEGRVLVDNQPLGRGTMRPWQRNVGYVPQSTFLADDTVAANIALGLPNEQIERDRVERAARVAHIHDFIVSKLRDGYETVVGERGIRLSGGERQRLAIARALYHDPDIIVFDEATSALDDATERAVMEAIYGLGSEKTIITIAHRLSTVRNCERIYVLDQGRLVDEGSFEALSARSTAFRRLAQRELVRE